MLVFFGEAIKMELLIRARNTVGRVPMKALYGDENEAQDVEYKKFYHAH